jgi:Grx4 family monothiol glutaredoxin
MSVLTVTSLQEVQNIQKGSKGVFFFWASWHEPSALGGQMQGVFSALATKYSNIKFVTVEAESYPEISEKFGVAVVPTFFATNNGALVGKVEGANPADLSKLVKQLVGESSAIFEEEEVHAVESVDLNARLDGLIRKAPIMLFMKGNPSEPRCGFSRKIVDLLQSNDVPFSTFDILSDQEVREGLKTYSDWPTYPQLYANAELIGGLDIVKEMADGGDLKGQLGL